MITIALMHLITSDAATNAIIAGRIHLDTDSQPVALPKVTIAVIDEQRGLTNDGPTNLPGANFRVDCWALTSAAAWILSNCVRDAIDGFSGTVTAPAVDGSGPTTYEISGLHVRSRYENSAPPVEGQNQAVKRWSLDVIVHHKD